MGSAGCPICRGGPLVAVDTCVVCQYDTGGVRSGGERYVRRAFILCDYITLMIEVSVLQTRMLSDAGEGDVRITKRLLGCTYLIATRISIHVMTCCIRVSSVIQDVMIVIGQTKGRDHIRSEMCEEVAEVNVP